MIYFIGDPMLPANPHKMLTGLCGHHPVNTPRGEVANYKRK